MLSRKKVEFSQWISVTSSRLLNSVKDLFLIVHYEGINKQMIILFKYI